MLDEYALRYLAAAERYAVRYPDGETITVSPEELGAYARRCPAIRELADMAFQAPAFWICLEARDAGSEAGGG